MKQRRYTHAIIFGVEEQMYQKIRQFADGKQVAIAEFLRYLIDTHFIRTTITSLDRSDSGIPGVTTFN